MGVRGDEPRVRLICRVDALQTGDLIYTPAHRWETVTGLDCGEAYSRSMRVATAETGPEYPWAWTNRHLVPVQRRRPVALASALTCGSSG